MKNITIGKPFTVRVQTSKQFRVHSGDFNGTNLFCEIVNTTGKSNPEINFNSADKVATVNFLYDHKIGDVYDIVITQQEKVVKLYSKPPVKKSVAGFQYFRGQIKESQKQLFPVLPYANCISFDQSYYTRGLGQLQIQSKLEDKYGKLTDKYKLASGAGFGALQALWLALGESSQELHFHWMNCLKKSVKKTKLAKIPGSLMGLDIDRINPKYIKKAFSKMFKKAKVRDLKVDVFIPIMDISGRVQVFNKERFKSELISDVAFYSVPDPVFFKLKAGKKGMGVLNGDISKNNDVFIRKNNPSINITRVGCPVRCYDKGYSVIARDGLALKISDQKHETDLMFSDAIMGPGIRYECKPIDEVYQFSTKTKQLEKALYSGDIEV